MFMSNYPSTFFFNFKNITWRIQNIQHVNDVVAMVLRAYCVGIILNITQCLTHNY